MPPLPPPAARSPLHQRRIALDGYRRDDGLWDIEAHLTDTKSYGFDNAWRGRVEAGTPVHEMHFRLTLDDNYVIQAVVAATTASPFEICPAIISNFQRLVGLRIGKGWMREVRARLAGPQGCTHLVELLQPMATVAFQTIAVMRERMEGSADSVAPADPPPTPRRPPVLDTCHALASDGDVVRRLYPAFYTGSDATTDR